MPEQTNIGYTPYPDKLSPQRPAAPQDGGMLEHMVSEQSRTAFADGLHELQRLHSYPCVDAVNRALQCFIQATYSCDSSEQWSLVLQSACEALRAHGSPKLDATVSTSLDGAVELLHELRDEFGDAAPHSAHALPT